MTVLRPIWWIVIVLFEQTSTAFLLWTEDNVQASSQIEWTRVGPVTEKWETYDKLARVKYIYGRILDEIMSARHLPTSI
jgi:hypothetical protein